MANEFVYAQLSACLALVRPVGMTECETEDWLAVAAKAIEHVPGDILEWGAKAARQKCTHHSQVVPTIIAETREAVTWHRRKSTEPRPQLVARKAEKPHRPLPAPDTLHQSLQRMGRKEGWLVDGPNGLQWAEDTAT